MCVCVCDECNVCLTVLYVCVCVCAGIVEMSHHQRRHGRYHEIAADVLRSKRYLH